MAPKRKLRSADNASNPETGGGDPATLRVDHPPPVFDAASEPPKAIDTVLPMATSVPAKTDGHGPKYRTRSIVFTIFDLATLDDLRTYGQNEVEYMRFGIETCPTTGRQHAQGWLQWNNPRSVQQFWKRFNHPHIEPRYGSVDHNQKYTSKDGVWEEFGQPPKQGERIDWTRAREELQQRHSVVEVINNQPHLLPTIRALERYATLSRQPPNDRDIRCIYIHGPSGCGKSRAVHQAYPNAYWKPAGEWWDGYEGQQVVVLDDYYGDQPYSQLLRVLDRYPLRLPVKGGFVPAEYTTVIITSNARPDEQYEGIEGHRRAPLMRRLTRVIDATFGISDKDITNALSPQEAHLPQEESLPQA